MTAVQIKKEFSDLPPEEQLELRSELWEQVASTPENFELSEFDQEELKRRYDEHLADPATAKSWDDVKAEIRGKR